MIKQQFFKKIRSKAIGNATFRASEIRQILKPTSISSPSYPAAALGWIIDNTSKSLVATVADATDLTLRVRSVSPEQICLEDPFGHVSVDTESIPLTLRAGTSDLTVDVTLDQTPPGSGVVAARPVSPSRAFARELLSLVDHLVATGRASSPSRRPLVHEVIADRLRQRAIVESLIQHGCTGVLRVGGFPIGNALPVGVTADGIVFHLSVMPPDGSFTIELESYNSLYSIDFDEMRTIDEGIVASPSRMMRLRHRSFRRVEPPTDTSVEFAHPLWTDFVVRRPIREISAQGLSLRTTLHEDLVYPGLHIPEIRLAIAGRSLRFSGEVKSLTRDPAGDHYYCGIHLYPSSAVDEDSWLGVLDECLHSTTRIRGAWARPMWDLYSRAGYFDLSGKNTSSFDPRFDSFERVSARIVAAPQLGCHAVWPHDEHQVEAAMSMVKVYAKSWLVFQLAKVTGATRRNVPGRVVLRDLHFRCYEHAQRDPELRWLIGIPQVRQTWSRLVHYDLPHKYVAAGMAATVRFRAVEISVAGPPAPPSTSLQIGVGSEDERAILIDQIRRTRSPVYMEALDLVPERFELSEVRQAWHGAGFSRKRAFYVARSRRGPEAAAILESADEGLHLFRLLDSVRLFSLMPGGEHAFGPLLAAARDWYAAQQKQAYVAFLEDDLPLPIGTPSGSTDLGLADLVILSALHLPELLEHVYEITAPRVSLAVSGPPPPIALENDVLVSENVG